MAMMATGALTIAACGSSGEVDATTSVADPTTTASAAPTTVAEPTTTSILATTTTTLSESAALALVESLFAAYNSGDMETWFMWREGGNVEPGDGDYEIAVGSRLDVKQCVSRGYGEWHMDGPLIGYGFDCEVTQTDLLLGAAGIELEMTYNWVIGPEGPEASLGGSNEDFEFVSAYLAEYRAWLGANYPEVEASVQYGEDGGEDAPFPSPEGVPTVLEYLDEFVAHSDVYPLTEPVPAGNYGGSLT